MVKLIQNDRVSVSKELLNPLLSEINRKWQNRFANCRKFLSPPWWTPDLLVTPEIKWKYEEFLPFDEFRHDLNKLARCILPDTSWVPTVLQLPDVHLEPVSHSMTLLDFWALLPTAFAGRLVFKADELLPLFCALADAPRFGTQKRRYPEQLKHLTMLTQKLHRKEVRFLDLACGVGHGTYEFYTILQKRGISSTGFGLTREPLEAWMAANRVLPHDSYREKLFPLSSDRLPVDFVAGDVRALPFHASFNIIFCNGLVGEDFLPQRQQFQQLLDQLRLVGTADTLVMLANNFHEGRLKNVSAFIEEAAAAGWRIDGDWRNLILHW